MSKNLLASLNSSLFSTPWAIFVDSHLIEGQKSPVNPICRTCESFECQKSSSPIHICKEGLESRTKKVGNSKITLFGFDHQKTKKNYRPFPVEPFNLWVTEVEKLNKTFEKEKLITTSETLHLFHDPVKLAEQIRISSEKMISSNKGDTFKDKFQNSSSIEKAIFQSSKLLTDSIKMIEVYFNPDSARYGKTTRCNVYRLLDKIQSIMYFSEGKSKNKKFKLTGKSHKEFYVYESFQIIILSLVHNALKYSKTRDIEISIEDTRDGVEVKIMSTGPLINPEEYELIFKKGYRGKHANKLHHDGMGIGLYVSKHIANAHKFKIQVESVCAGYQSDGIDLANNIFSFEINSNCT
ncbi:ATP-binding protein [Shewanella algae]|uniref:ATP-binding protein n=1 Tax=Shewanella algae TaxID=38313 RepID=UPI001BED646F|nr:ATP-binding protein [Shewanella algae]BCV51079.1 hypothetical protein TUM17382_37720 [Shewanella algae]